MKAVRGSLTILTDNTVPELSDTIAEHWFYAFLETEQGNFLFDTGKGKTVVQNAAILKKDLTGINKDSAQPWPWVIAMSSGKEKWILRRSLLSESGMGARPRSSMSRI